MALLLTRPEGRNEELAAFFERLKYQTGACPLIQIELGSLNGEQKRKLHRAKHIILTSQNALPVLDQSCMDAAFHVVGERTAELLQGRGYKNIRSVALTSEALFSKLLEQESALEEVVFLSGDKVSLDFEKDLRARGIEARRLIVYRSQALEKLPEDLVRAIEEGSVRYVALFSSFTAQTWLTLVKKHRLEPVCKKMICLAFSPQIAEFLKGVSWEDIYICPQPSLKMFCSFAQEMILKEKINE